MIRKLGIPLLVASVAAFALAEEKVVVQYDCIPNYANWGA